MESAQVLEIAEQAIWTLLAVSTPVMLVALTVGLTIALFQALTQIQEITLTFVPKIIAIFVSLLMFLPFMSSTLATFMEEIAARIAGIG